MGCANECGCNIPVGIISNTKRWKEIPPQCNNPNDPTCHINSFTEIQCDYSAPDGKDEPRAWKIDVTNKYGLMTIAFDAFGYESTNTYKDRLVVWLDQTKILDSGCVATRLGDNSPTPDGWVYREGALLGTNSGGYFETQFYIPKSARRVWIMTQPNCSGGTGTYWTMKCTCPNGVLKTNDRLIFQEYRNFQYGIDSFNNLKEMWS